MYPETTKERAKKIVSYLKQNCTLPIGTPENLNPTALTSEIEKILSEVESVTNNEQEK